MNRLGCLVLAVILASPVPAFAQTCTPARIDSLLWAPVGAALAPVPKYWTAAANGYAGDPNGFVPPGEVWLIKSAGGFTNDGAALEWMLQIEHHTLVGDACCWLPPLHRPMGTAAATPVIALERPILLEAGERLSLRVNGLRADKSIGIAYVGWKFPAACLPRLLGVEAGSGTPVDYSGFATALQQAATALQTAAEAVP